MVVTVPLLVVAGCADPVPVEPPSCAAAFDATVRSLSAMLGEAGVVGTFPERAPYVARCDALSLTSAQLRCLEPAAALADPVGCEAALAPVRDDVEALAAWFDEHTVLPDPRSPLPDRSRP
jgi:hypothetical protein